MSNLYGLAPATLDPSLCVLLFLYGIFFGADFLVFAYSFGIRRVLPFNFLICGLITAFTIFISLGIAIYFLLTLNYDCVFGRKLLYVFNYIGYLSYDYYQVKKIIERTRPSRYEVWMFALLYAGRVATICYNMYYMSGIIANPMKSGPFIGAGPCKTIVTPTMVYQEHIYNIIMELLMIAKVFQFAFSLNSKKTSWKKIMRYVFDFEIFSFIYYLCCEILYMIFYRLLPPAQVSFVNVFYNQVYVFLFLANATHFCQDRVKKAEKLGVKIDKKLNYNARGKDSQRSTEIVRRTVIQ
ncbi:hypothetical protein HDV04_002876 [Boothiomyces sp. JEL0838]|nr:hypothetical protein HDV04_002876 [Boothiomyces sp. JEL0838]